LSKMDRYGLVTIGKFLVLLLVFRDLSACKSSRYQHAIDDARVRNAKPNHRPQKISDGGGLHPLLSPQGSSYGAWLTVMPASRKHWFLAPTRP